MSKYDAYNFFESTAALFTVCDEPQGEPDYISNSGSAYWYVNGGVVRRSDHWGYGIASCNWWLGELDMKHYDNVDRADLLDIFGAPEICAFCSFESFRNTYDLFCDWISVNKSIGFKVNPLF